MRKLLSIILVIFLSMNLFGCHGSSGLAEFKMPEGFDTSKNYEITFWAKNDSNKNQVAIYRQAIEDFQKIYPNITVNVKWYTDYTRIYNDVITNISTNTTPNVCISYPDHIATYLTGKNIMVSLDELMDDKEYGLGGSKVLFDSPSKQEIVPEFLDEGIINDKYYAMPFMRSTEACYINKTYLEKLGYKLPETLTWDFIFEVSAKATAKDKNGNFKVNGQKVMIPFIYKSTDNMMIQMLHQLNAGYSKEDGTIEIFNDDTKEILYAVADSVSLGAFSTFKISSYPANFLNAGQCIFAIDSTAGSTWMGSDAPLLDIPEDQIVDFETVVMPIPQYDVDNPSMISQGPSICIFNKQDSNEVMASWLFVQYLLSDQVQIAYSQTEGYVPVTLKAQSNPEYQKYLSIQNKSEENYYVKIQAVKIFLDNISNTFVTPVFNGSASLRNAAGQMIEEVTKAINRGKVVNDAYIQELYENMNTLYHLDEASSAAGGKSDLGELPSTSKGLLITLGCIWLLLGIYFVVDKIRNKKKR